MVEEGRIAFEESTPPLAEAEEEALPPRPTLVAEVGVEVGLPLEDEGFRMDELVGFFFDDLLDFLQDDFV